MVWLHPRVSLVYKFYGGRQPKINPVWIEALMFSANAPTGLYAVAEPPEGAKTLIEALERKIAHETH